MEGVDLPLEAQAQPTWHIWGAIVVFGGRATRLRRRMQVNYAEVFQEE
jgi:hypothetical protein